MLDDQEGFRAASTLFVVAPNGRSLQARGREVKTESEKMKSDLVSTIFQI